MQVPEFARIEDYRWNWMGNKSIAEDPRCKVSDILYKNINLLAEDGIDLGITLNIKEHMKCSDFSDIVFENIMINGKKVSDLGQFTKEMHREVVLK